MPYASQHMDQDYNAHVDVFDGCSEIVAVHCTDITSGENDSYLYLFDGAETIPASTSHADILENPRLLFFCEADTARRGGYPNLHINIPSRKLFALGKSPSGNLTYLVQCWRPPT